jgi:hypothetical protein
MTGIASGEAARVALRSAAEGPVRRTYHRLLERNGFGP